MVRSLVILSSLLVAVCVALPQSIVEEQNLKFESLSTSLDTTWENFKTKHGKQYSSVDEEQARKQIFADNLRKIELHNYLYSKGLRTFSRGINQFTDMDYVEVAQRMNGFRMPKAGERLNSSTYMSPNIPIDLPAEVDWRKMGYVTPIKDQGQCGSCWAFSATGSLEGQHFRKTHKLVSLSEQNLVDCSGKQGDFGCGGGLMDYAFQYVKENGGIDTEQSYPYTAQDGQCHFSKANVGATCTGFVDLPKGDEEKLKEVVATVGPVSVAINAAQEGFMQYSGGVYYEKYCDPEALDHGVLVVGYGTTTDGQDYWLVKNSWGTSWGESGYIRMARNKNNMCGIVSMASYPLV